MIRGKAQTYNDTLLAVYDVENTAQPGLRPVKKLVKRHVLRGQERTVGVTRFYEAKAAQERVDRLVRVPRCGELTTDQMVVLNGNTNRVYTICQVQYPVSVVPPSIDLSLRVIEEGDAYDFE